MSVWSRIEGLTGGSERVRPVRVPSFETLEPRLLLSADLNDATSLLSLQSPLEESAIVVDLDQENGSGPETPLVSFETGQSAPVPEDSGQAEGTVGPVDNSDEVSPPVEADLGSAGSLMITGLPQVEYNSQTGVESQVAGSSCESESAGLAVTDQQDSTSGCESLPSEARGPPLDVNSALSDSYVTSLESPLPAVSPVFHTQMYQGVDVEPTTAPLTQEFPLLGFPASYDLRSLGYVTPVKNQGGAGSCWAFATYGGLESTILRDGGSASDLSENHLKNYHGFDWGPTAGGNYYLSQAYLSRWDGPVSETADPYHDYDDRPSPGGPPQYYVREVLEFNTDDELKNGLMTYGAVGTSMYIDSNSAHGYYNPTTFTYYYNGTNGGNHAVTIVGWDDAKSVPGAPGPGAWLIKNSWGTGWGNLGYFWLSYYDTRGGNDGFCFYDAVGADTYQGVYYYDDFGSVTSYNCPYGLNKFVASSNQQLEAVGFWTKADGASYDLRVYDTLTGNSVSDLLASVTGTLAFAGSHTIDLPSPLSLSSGNDFYLSLHITNGGDYPMACDQRSSGYTSASTANPGETYWSWDGVSWGDMNSVNATANFCIKGFVTTTTPPEIAVQGNGTPIADGDMTPSATDGTDFGSVAVGSTPITRTFTVSNAGTGPLALKSLTVPTGFTVTEGLPATLAPGASDTFTVRLDTTVVGTKRENIILRNDDNNEHPFNFAINGVVQGPEITVLGNGVWITDGDTTPTTLDWTDFDSVTLWGSPVNRTFTVRNDGNQPLTLGTVVAPAGFAVTEGLSTSLAPGASDTFTVQMDTNTAGTKSGEISFTNNDYDENAFNFQITGTVALGRLFVDSMESYTSASGQRIYQIWIDGRTNGTGSQVGHSSSPYVERTIVHGGAQSMPFYYDNADTPFYSEASRTFTSPQDWTAIGVDTLSLWVRGRPASFIQTGPAAFTISGGGHDIWDNADDFRFVYLPLTGDGSVTARVDGLVNTDPWAKAGVMIRQSLDEGSAHADVVVTPDNSCSFQWRTTAGSGSSYTGWSGAPVTAPYWVRLTRTGNTFRAETSPDGTTWTQLGGTQTITMGVDVYIGLAVTSHNTSTATTAQFSNVATTGAVGGPWQGIWLGNDDPRTNDPDYLYVAIQDAAGHVGVVSSASTTLVNASAWTEWTIPLSSFAGVDRTQVKTVYIGAGNRQSPVADGRGLVFVDDIVLVAPDIAEISALGNAVGISDGDTTPGGTDGTDFGAVVQGGTPISRAFTVRNEGSATLTLGSVTVPSGYTLTEGLSTTLAGGTSDTFTVQLDTGVLGTKTGDISFTNNDADENPFNFRITGIVQPPSPEITVLGNGVSIVDGDATPSTADGTDFGSVAQRGGAISHTFTVRNDGTATLTLGALTVPAGFTVTETLSASLTPGASDTFTVRLDVATQGDKTGEISFSNNDNDENPFNFQIRGTVALQSVDDMESYTDEPGYRIYDTWIDGLTNATGSRVGYLTAPFAERTIVHGGTQAMPFYYDNDQSPFYSEASRTFASAQNWTASGSDALGLWVRGRPVPFVQAGPDTFTLGGAGHDIWDNADDFRFAYRPLTGDGSITVRVDSLTNTNSWAKAGVMIRQSLTDDSAFADVVVTPGNSCSFQWRNTTGGSCSYTGWSGTAVTAPYWVRLTRTGDDLKAETSPNGTTWTQLGATQTIAMGTDVYLGLAVTSHNRATATAAQFSHVTTVGAVSGSWEGIWLGDDPPLTNDPAGMYVALEDAAGHIAIVNHPDPTAANVPYWTQWAIPLSSFTGVDLTQVKTLYLGVGNRQSPAVDGSGLIFVDDIVLGGAEIGVLGNSAWIVDGDTTPEALDGTDFGTATQGGAAVIHTFRVRNDGVATLTLGTPTVPSGFAVAGLAGSLSPGAYDDFTVTLNTTTPGIKSGDVSIPNSDGDENPFNFRIAGWVNPVGGLDTSFADTGKVTTNIGPSGDWGYSVACQSDGKIVVAGYSTSGSNNDFALVRYNANGSLDTSFDSDGKVTTPVGSSSDYAYSVAVQSDGKIVAAGYSSISGNGYDFALVRYNPNGSLDTSFDSDGKVTTAIGSSDDYGRSVALQSDGKIVVAGYSYNGSNYDFALVRYNPNGSLDTTGFGMAGKVTTPLGSGDDHGYSVAIQSDGKIVVAGDSYNGSNYDFALVRYNSDGSLDTSFDGDGKVTTPIGSSSDYGYGVVVQSDGKILVAGYSGGDFALVRYNSNGSLDTSFDGDGKVTTPIGSSSDYAYGVALQSDGKIVVAGYMWTGSTWDFALARYSTDGSLDTSFDGDGKLTTPVGSGDDYGRGIALQSGGKIVVAGYSYDGSNADFALVRYNTNGSLDTSFDGDGKVTTAFGSASNYGYSVALQSDGKILLAGYSYNGSNYDFAVVRYNANGSLDASFDGDGIVTTDFGSSDYGYSIALQPDGKILVAGCGGGDFAVARYNPNGSLDTSFDGDGKVTTPIGSSTDYGYSVALQPDGKIVVAGYSYNGSNNDVALVRYNADGSLDTSFDGDGKVTTPIGVSDDYGRSVAIQSDGKIVVAGYSYNGNDNDFALVRYNANGSLDTSFDGDGKVTTPFGSWYEYGYSVALQPDGKIVVGGFAWGDSSYDFALARYNSNGSLDTSFDGDGKVVTPIGSSSDYGYSVTLQSDGKIVLAGETYNGSNYDFALVRYGADGSVDTSFGADGKVTTALGSADDSGRGVALQSDSKIVVAGYSYNGSDYDFALVRYQGGSPEITVLGNGVSIADGDVTPSLTDHTDFGTVAQGGSAISRTFTVRNDGTGLLMPGAVTVPTGYTLTEALSTSLAPGATDTFTVQLDTASAGTKTGDITFGNNDSDENPFNFRITGTVNPAAVNLALGKTAVASTSYTGMPASNATDGNASSRWSSQFSDSQWIYVDLGSAYTISRVVLRWETAYGRGYKLQVSNDASTWWDVYSTTTGDGGVDDITLSTPASGRYVRMLGTQRATTYGYSLYELEVYGGPVANLALNKPAVASTSYTGFPAANATDGNATSRWASQFSNNEWIYVDLGSVYTINQVVLRWEAAYGRGYKLQVSSDASTWSDVYSTTTGDGGVDAVALSTPASGRYVRMLGTQRATTFGYSLYELEVYGTSGGTPEITVLGNAVSITDGDTSPSTTDGTDFGSVVQGGAAVSRTFMVRNDGAAALTLGAVTVPTGFTLTEGLSTTLAAGASDTFTVRLDAATLGTKSGEVSFATNDSDENPFSFAIMGAVNSAAVNLALGKTAVASSTYTGFPASNATDGNTSTRWASQSSDSQWLYVDLGSVCTINRVVLRWETAYGRGYKLQVSSDASTWSDVYSTTTGDGGIDDITLSTPASGRYVRMLGTQRATTYGYSLYELEVYGASVPNLALGKTAAASTTYTGFPASNVTDGNASTRWASQASDGQWIYVDLGSVYTINQVVLRWEAAYGRGYQLQVSGDASTWSDVYSTTTGDGGADAVTLSTPAAGRYVRMLGTQRATTYGYSLYELEVYGGTAGPEITVLGNAVSIADGDTTPSTADGTDFGSVTQGGVTVSRTFTVRNDGGAALTLGAVTVPTGFTLTEGLSTTLAAGASDTFTVRLDTTTLGTKSGEASFTTNDSDENPFHFAITGTVSPVAVNLALGKTAVASSTYTGFPASNATDGNTSTRWASLAVEGQWIDVDLGLVYAISRVVLRWEAAYGRGYKLQVSNDGSTWSDVYSTTTGDGGIDDISLATPAFGRYVRMLGTQRGTTYGYSLYELEVYGGGGGGAPEIAVLGNGLSITAGDATPGTADGTDFGSVAQNGVPVSQTFTVRNDGAVALSLGAVTVPRGFALTEGLSTRLAVGASDTFTVQLDAAAALGTKSGVVSFAVNDSDENPFSFAITGTVAPAVNLALGKTAVASTTYTGFPASNVTDGNTGTRWASQSSDSQWLYVDLGSVSTISRIVLRWEAAYGRGYQLQVSNDASTWSDVYTTTTGDGGVDDITLTTPASGRYVRMLGTQRATTYGYSLYELEVYPGLDNLLPNGGFESGAIAPYSIYGTATSGIVTACVGADVPETPIEGTRCLHVVVPAAGVYDWDVGMVDDSQTFQAGKTYTFSAWVKCKSGTLAFRMKPEHGEDPWVGYNEQVFIATDQWQEFSVTTPVMTADVTPASPTFHLAFAPGDFWIDDVKLYEAK